MALYLYYLYQVSSDNLIIILVQVVINRYINMQPIQKPKKKKVGDFIIFLSKQLGKGAQASVFLAVRYDKNIRTSEVEKAGNNMQKFAVKVFNKSEIQETKRGEDAILYEVEIMRSVKSPNIIQFICVEYTANNTYIFQQFANNGTLQQYRESKPKQRFTEEEVIECFGDLLNGFIELQRHGIMHRDIKPSNILIKDGVFKIADFGLSRYSGSKESVKSVFGTPLYMAPQIIIGITENKPCFYTEKCDIWSLGVVAYELITGKLPWVVDQNEHTKIHPKLIQNQIQNCLEIPPNVPISDNLKHFIKGCLQYQQDDRFSWNQVFSHPIFGGRFTNIAYNLENYLITDLRIKVHSENINIEKFVSRLPQVLTKQQFYCFLLILLPSVTEKQAQNLYKVIGQQKKIVSTQNILNFFQDRKIKVRGLKGKKLQQQKEQRKKIELIEKKISSGAEDNHIDLFKFYQKFAINDQARINREEFNLILTTICPDANKQELDELFDYFNVDTTPTLHFDNFYELLCQAAQVPTIKQERLWNGLKILQERKKN